MINNAKYHKDWFILLGNSTLYVYAVSSEKKS